MHDNPVGTNEDKTGDGAMESYQGYCCACDQATTFDSHGYWYRDQLLCRHCGSIPRERALGWCLSTFAPDWRSLDLHECSPAERAISLRMSRECEKYIATQYFPDVTPGSVEKGVRCENLQALTFPDESIDLHVHLDVLEHVNDPGACFAEMKRTLRPGGRMIFTTPVYRTKAATERRAYIGPDQVNHFAEPEYHGNPISDDGALVTFHYGQDLADIIAAAAPGCGVNMITMLDARLGILGEFREVFVVTKWPTAA